MKNSSRIAVIGERDSILAFKALGMDVFPCTETLNIKAIIRDLSEQEYSIILITENEAEKVEDYINRMKKQPYPIILPIPDGAHNTSFGMKKMYENIEKAIGKEGKK